MIAGQVGLDLYDYFERNTYKSLRNTYSKKSALKLARVDVIKLLFFYSVIRISNSLPTNVIEQTNSDVFFDLCKTFISVN